MKETTLKINSPRHKYLVFTSAGDNSNLHLWLQGRRNFDLWITYYGVRTPPYRDSADFYNVRKDCKFSNFYYVYTTWKHILEHYEAVIIMDDDIVINGSEISRLFEIRQQYDLWLCQPAFDPRGKISHKITEVKPYHTLRYTNFVEVTCPLFRKDKLDAFMKVFNPNLLIEWGVDWWFLENLGPLEGKVAVVDAIVCINPFDHTKTGQQREIDKLVDEKARIKLWQKFKAQYGNQSEQKGYAQYGSVKFKSIKNLIDVLKVALRMSTVRL